ncbi:MAG: DUF502 domain-containing protein [bacterium]|nr:DUF502 domain-containing protein [bacterium]
MAKKYFKGGLKIVIPFAVVLWFFSMIYNIVNNFWQKYLFESYMPYWAAKDSYDFIKIAFVLSLTAISLFLVGYIFHSPTTKKLGLSVVLNKLIKHLPLVKYFWSDLENSGQTITPVLFQYPMPGQWKLGFVTGKQKQSDGKEYVKIFFVTGPGDHTFIDSDRAKDLIVPLQNPTTEVLQLIASFMVSGPNVLITEIKKK